MSKSDKINPDHYKGEGDKECIDWLVDKWGEQKIKIWCRINVDQYLWRADKKNESPEEDIEKAMWYLAYSVGMDPRKL